MELILLIGSLILLAIAAHHWGHDSRGLLSNEPWVAEPRPKGSTRRLSRARATRASPTGVRRGVAPLYSSFTRE